MFLDGIFEVLLDIITYLTAYTARLINGGIEMITQGSNLDDYSFNLVLFSETPIISLDGYQLIAWIFSIFYTIFFIVLLYKVTKNIIKKVFGVIKL